MSDNDKGQTVTPEAQAENQGQQRFYTLLNELRAALRRPSTEAHTPNLDVETDHG